MAVRSTSRQALLIDLTSASAADGGRPESTLTRQSNEVDFQVPHEPQTESEGDVSEPVGAQRSEDAPHVRTVLMMARAMQRNALILSVVAAVIAIVVAYLVRGVPGGIGAAVGAVLALALGYLGTFVMAKTARATPIGVMAGAMTAFAGKIAFMLVFLLLLRDTTLFDNRSFAITLLAVTFAYIIGEVVGFVRTRMPVVDI